MVPGNTVCCRNTQNPGSLLGARCGVIRFQALSPDTPLKWLSVFSNIMRLSDHPGQFFSAKGAGKLPA